jgi:hypothetical protein
MAQLASALGGEMTDMRCAMKDHATVLHEGLRDDIRTLTKALVTLHAKVNGLSRR